MSNQPHTPTRKERKVSDIQPASFADLKKAWDFWRHHKDQDRPVTDTPNYRTYRLEFLRGIDQIKTQAKADALRDAANSGLFVGPIADMLEARADQMEGDDE